MSAQPVSTPITRLLSVTEVEERSGLPKQTIYKLVAEQRLAHHRIGRNVRISESDLAAFIASARREAS